MRIGVDIDGVMYNWDKTVRYMLREILPNSPYTAEGPLGKPSKHWDYVEHNVSKEHWKWLWTEGVKLGMFRHGHMYPGTIKAIRQLSELGDVIAVTHRPKSAVEDTLAWLGFHRLPLAGIHILTNQEPKTSVGRFDVFIDDKPQNCLDLRETCDVVAMPDRPWNDWKPSVRNAQDLADQHGVMRVYSWDEFLIVVEHFKRYPGVL